VSRKVAAIVLAAGESRRMGQPKLMMPFAGTTIIERTVENVLDSSVDEVILVTGHNAEGIAGLFKGKLVRVVHNVDYRRGMITSIMAGAQAARADMEAILVMPGDQPTVTGATINLVLDAFRNSRKGMAVPVYQGRTGHPAVFSLKYRDELARLHDQGARGLIYGHPDDVLRIAVDAAEVRIDIDTMLDYTRATGEGGLPDAKTASCESGNLTPGC
jgi:molybdenum cofactor cytidylyltransferase